jgi:hypothetical protein
VVSGSDLTPISKSCTSWEVNTSFYWWVGSIVVVRFFFLELFAIVKRMERDRDPIPY